MAEGAEADDRVDLYEDNYMEDEDIEEQLDDDVRLIKDKGTGESKGYAFVAFITGEEAQKAIEKLHNKELRSSLSESKSRLFIGNVPKSMKDDEFRKVIEEVGTGVETIELIKVVLARLQNEKKVDAFNSGILANWLAGAGYCGVISNPFGAPHSGDRVSSSSRQARASGSWKILLVDLVMANKTRLSIEGLTRSKSSVYTVFCLLLLPKGTKMRPVFVGNFEYETRQSELERLFSKYGRVERVDMKSGFAFVYFEDERDAADAIRGLDNAPFGYDKRRLSVEWAKGERGRVRDGSGLTVNKRPTRTLFVINFDPLQTRVRDIERHFEPYGKILNVRIRRNFAFVQFETQDDATKALECTHMSKLLDRVVSVEYALRDDDERDEKLGSPRRGSFGRRGDSPYRRSLSPVYRGRQSPDYGRPRSPVYDRYDAQAYDRRRSPDYGRPRSLEYGRFRSPSPMRRSRN
ncbi:hypothetical protein SAY86_010510 [Trapa natans]|uniref:RRM domain-containing protein n=1 Tax=Trapa natans TaxID=22666 RepID=A0AAN7R1X3_TRANT|nr:hypothetical protein SAY86_010510 [Trapa natans]